MRCSRVAPVIAPVIMLAALAALTISASGCKKRAPAPVAASNDESQQSLVALRAKVGTLQKSIADLHARLNRLPEDLPGLDAVRSKIFALDEVMGIAGARVNWMADNLNKAAAAGNAEELRQITATIKSSLAGCEGIAKTVVETMHELLPYERIGAQLQRER